MHQHSASKNDHKHIRYFNRAFAIAVFLTTAYIVVEVVYGFLANSMSLLADAVHNLGDVLGLLLAWLANWLLSFPARKRYSYGYKRTTIIAALVNAAILIATSVLIAYESIHKLFNLKEINETIVIAIGILGIFVNGGCSLLFMRGAHDDMNIKGAFLHLLADALILVGVVLGAVIIKFTGVVWLDPVIGLCIVAIVLYGTWGLLRNSVRLILDAVPHYIDYAGVRNYLASLPGVTSIHDLHIWGLSTREVALTAHLVMPEHSLSDADLRGITTYLHERFRVDHATLQVEKGNTDHPCITCESS